MEDNKFLLGKATLPLMDKTFGLKRVMQADSLDAWLKSIHSITLSDNEKFYCQVLQDVLILNRDSWQEQELSLHFIGPMFSAVRFTEIYKFNLFAQRPLSVTYQDWQIMGKPDGLIASGYYEPEIPYFAFSEYKKQLDPNGDPAGQALAAMLAGQVLNEDSSKPIYGCYVIGTSWYFMILENKNYCISQSYDAATDDLFDILKILKKLKIIIQERVRKEELG